VSATPFRPLTKSDVAEVLGVSIRTIENLVKSQRMPAPGHVGGRALWHPEIFYSWLDMALRMPCAAGDDVTDASEGTTENDGSAENTSLGLWSGLASQARDLSKGHQKEALDIPPDSQSSKRKSSGGRKVKLSAGERMQARQAKRLQWDSSAV